MYRVGSSIELIDTGGPYHGAFLSLRNVFHVKMISYCIVIQKRVDVYFAQYSKIALKKTKFQLLSLLRLLILLLLLILLILLLLLLNNYIGDKDFKFEYLIVENRSY